MKLSQKCADKSTLEHTLSFVADTPQKSTIDSLHDSGQPSDAYLADTGFGHVTHEKNQPSSTEIALTAPVNGPNELQSGSALASCPSGNQPDTFHCNLADALIEHLRRTRRMGDIAH